MPELTVYIAAGILGDRTLAMSDAVRFDELGQLPELAALAEEAEAVGVSQVSDAIGTDFFPAVNANGFVPRNVYEAFGPRLRLIATRHYSIV